MITKPGPKTIAEAATTYRKYRTPFVLVDQKNCLFWETSNSQLVEKSHFGKSFVKNKELIEKVIFHLKTENPSFIDPFPKQPFQVQFANILKELTESPPTQQVI